jgi:hypothetical protein
LALPQKVVQGALLLELSFPQKPCWYNACRMAASTAVVECRSDANGGTKHVSANTKKYFKTIKKCWPRTKFFGMGFCNAY